MKARIKCKNNNSISALILQLNTMPTNTARQLQDEHNSRKNVNMEITKSTTFHISDTLMLMQMELDARQNLGK
jgi:hypothetical protein